MYGVSVVFDDGTNPFCRFEMTRQEYNKEMKQLQERYNLEIERVVDDENVFGNRMIFAKAELRKTKDGIKEREVAKSRAGYYSRRNGRAGKSGSKRCGTEG